MTYSPHPNTIDLGLYERTCSRRTRIPVCRVARPGYVELRSRSGASLAYIPPGTELDIFDGRTFVSLVGFRFLQTKLLGIFPIPYHSNFDEVNLRFYVRRQEGAALRRGVVFIREIVPRRAIAGVARLVYGENYTHHAMRHSINKDGACYSAEYEWQFERRWCRLYADTSGIPATPLEGSLEQFITEHHWGYSRRRDGACVE